MAGTMFTGDSKRSGKLDPSHLTKREPLLKFCQIFSIQVDSHVNRARISRKNQGDASTCSKISLDSIGGFNLRCRVSGDYGSKMAFYQGSYD